MHRLGAEIYSNFQISDIQPRKCQKVNALVIGPCGSGKTKLLNNLCDSTHKNGSYSVYTPTHLLRLYNSPVTNPQQNLLQSSQILRQLIHFLPINIIIINISLNTRFSKMIQQFKQHLNMFQNYQLYVICFISDIDRIDSSNNDSSHKISLFSQFNQQFIRNFCNGKFIAYSNKNSDFYDLSKTILKLGQSNLPQSIKITDRIFYKYFNIYQSQYNPVKQQIQQYIQKIKDQCQIFIDYLKDFNRDIQHGTEIISQLKLFMKFHLKNIQHEQYKKYSQNIKDDSIINDIFLTTSKIIQSNLQYFEQQQTLKYQKTFYDPQTQTITDIRDLIKQCPNCGMIWMKALGCNLVSCGQNSTNKDYHYQQKNYHYQFTISNSTITCKTIKNQNPKTIPPDIPFQLPQSQPTFGCGHIFYWGIQPYSKRVQLKLKQLFGISNFQQISLQMKWLEKQYQQFHRKIKKNVQQYMANVKI